MAATEQIRVTALYKFVGLDDLEQRRQLLFDRCSYLGIKGTLLLAPEGINGTIAAAPADMDSFLQWLKADPKFADLVWKDSFADEQPFLRLKVRLKKEIVTMGVTDLDPNDVVGTYVDPQDWNDLIDDPSVILVDTRNDYEVAIGTFDGAIDPQTKSFREMPQWMAQNLDPDTTPKLAMFCTGGIRCEKSTALAKQMGFDEVYHLKGGILKYLEHVPEEQSKWQGECFVFDQRVSVKHGLEVGNYDLCHACRQPLDEQARSSTAYIPGVQCPHCADQKTADQRRRYQERQNQVTLAKKRGQSHLGS